MTISYPKSIVQKGGSGETKNKCTVCVVVIVIPGKSSVPPPFSSVKYCPNVKDGKIYPLPPSLGLFPICKVDDYIDRVPLTWRQHGGVFIPVSSFN